MGQSFSEARTSTFEKLFEALPGERTALRTSSFNGPESSPLVADYNRAEHRLTLVNDAVITLGSADKWSRFAGAEFGGAWLDEPSHYGSDLHDLLEMMGSRLRGVAGPKVMFWTLTGAGYNAAYEILAQRQDANGEPIGLNIDVIRASTLDNPYLDEADKERFKRQYVGTGREEQALEGGFAAARGLVYDDFRRDTHVIPHGEARERIDPEWRIFGYDAGWSDPRVLLEIGKTGYGQLVILDEYHQSNSHVDGAIRWLQGHNKPQRTIFAEHEPADIERFRQAGWRTVKAAKSLDAGIAEVQKRLRTEGADDVAATPGDGSAGATVRPPRVTKPYTGSAGSGSSRSSSSKSSTTTSSGVGPTPDPVPASELTSDGPDADAEPESGQGQGQGSGRFGLLVAANCEHLIQEFLSYKTEHVGTSQAADHCLDSLRYACMGIAGNVNGDGGGRPKRQTIPSTW